MKLLPFLFLIYSTVILSQSENDFEEFNRFNQQESITEFINKQKIKYGIHEHFQINGSGLSTLTRASKDAYVTGHIALYPSYEITPTVSFALIIPQNLKDKPTNSASVSFNSGNSYNPKQEAPCNEGDCKLTYDVDTVADRIDLRATKKLSENFELDLSAGTYAINGKSDYNPLGYLVNDDFIEWFHTNIQGKEDPFGRKLEDFDQSRVVIIDKNGNELELETRKTYYIPVKIGINFYQDILRTKDKLTTFNVGTYLAIPVSSIASDVSAGLTLNFAHSQKLNKKINWSTAAGVFATKPDLYKVHKDSVQLMENGYFLGFHLTGGITYKETKDITWNFILSANMRSRVVDPKNYNWEFSETDERGQRVLGGHNEYWQISINRKKKNWWVQISLREDLKAFTQYTDDFFTDGGGPNGEDLGVNFSAGFVW